MDLNPVSKNNQVLSAYPTPDLGCHFRDKLSQTGLSLARGVTSILQVNIGLLCNQSCRHCHLEAGPNRGEMMSRETVDEVVSYTRRGGFKVVDITGGAPELNPHLTRLIKGLRLSTDRILIRSNLTALAEKHLAPLMDVFKIYKVVVVASFPSLQEGQTENQRGPGVFQTSIGILRKLNEIGYGQKNSGLELNLVSNPSGAFPPPSQPETETRFRQELARRWGLVFNHLYVFANVPLGRYRKWLDQSGNLGTYREKLALGFNPATLSNVMCRSQISVSWEGNLYDCDFNLALNLPFGGQKKHIRKMTGPPPEGTPILVGDHCYACTTGNGFT